MSIFVNFKEKVKTTLPLISLVTATSCFSMDGFEDGSDIHNNSDTNYYAKDNSNENLYIRKDGVIVNIPSKEKISAEDITQENVLGMFNIQLIEGEVKAIFHNSTSCTVNFHSFIFTDADENLNSHVKNSPLFINAHQKDKIIMKDNNQKAKITFIDETYESKLKTFELYFYKASGFRIFANPLQSLTGYGKSTFTKKYGWMLYATEVQPHI